MRPIAIRLGEYAIVAAVAIAAWLFTHKQAAPGEGVQEAKQAPEVAGVQRVPIHPEVVNALPPEAKSKIKLPKSMQDNPKLAVLDSSTIAPSDNGQTATTVLDERGNVITLVSENPAPWIAGESKGGIRVDYGLKNGGIKAWRLSAHENLFQFKEVHVGIAGSIYTDGNYFIGLGAGYYW